MNNHDCPGLSICDDHPRWHVGKVLPNALGIEGWWAIGGDDTPDDYDATLSTFAEAVAYATERARGERLAAVQSAEGVTAR